MQLTHVKLKNGDDLVCEHVYLSNDMHQITNALQIVIEPETGIFAKSWMLLSDAKTVSIHGSEILYTAKASDKAVTCYEEFIHRMNDDREARSSVEEMNDLENMFNNMLEAKTSIKH